MAIKEFFQNGFEKASTNEIVKNAKISKGSLFNYFHSKKGLYEFLIEYSIQIIETLYDQIDLTERDIFKRIEHIGLQKLHIYKQYPYVFDFLASTMQEEAIEVKDVIKQKVNQVYEQGTALIYQQIDKSKFREDIEVDKAIEILNWTMMGFGQRAIHQLNTFNEVGDFGEAYLEEWNKYSDILKNSFYK